MSGYLLPYDQYSFYNAICWGNCYNHFNNVCNDNEGSCWKSAFHITVTLIECFPLVSQIVSLAEFCIGMLYYYYFPPYNMLPNRPPELTFEDTPFPPIDIYNHLLKGPVPPPLQPLELPVNGKISDKGFFYNENFKNSSPQPVIANVLWTSIFSFLDHADLDNSRLVSRSFNAFIVCTPVIANILPLSQRKLYEISPKFFQKIGGNPRDASLRLQRRASALQELIKEMNDHWFSVTPDILSIVQTEFRTDIRATNYCRIILACPNDFIESHYFNLAMCSRSTRESLFVQFLFLYAFYDTSSRIPLTKDNLFLTHKEGRSGDHVRGKWEKIFDHALKLLPQ